MLELKEVSKRFGTFTAVDNLSFTIQPGQILSLIGQNGAGKSTTFHMILNFIKPDSGQILWNGKLIEATDLTAKVGYMPEERGLYQKETIENQIYYFAALHGMKKSEAFLLLQQWMKKLNVVGKLTDRVDSLSKGNAQKIQLIACLMFKPKLLILDEPFSGLDPVNSALLIDAILASKKQGTSIIFSTHNMAYVQKISDYIVMLSHGRTILKGTLMEIRKHFGRCILEIEGYSEEEKIKKFSGVNSVSNHEGKLYIILASEKYGEPIFHEVISKGYIPVFNQRYPDLEEIFKLEVQKYKV